MIRGGRGGSGGRCRSGRWRREIEGRKATIGDRGEATTAMSESARKLLKEPDVRKRVEQARGSFEPVMRKRARVARG